MHKTLLTSWPLFFGLSMLMIGNGLQGTLLGVRASLENFDTTAIGLIMSFYYVGFLGGSFFVPRLVSRVGHIRVFAALSALAAITALLHGLFTNEIAWSIVRTITGFSFAGLYIVIESWLNNITTNKIRGKMLALYLIVLYGSMVAGQFLLVTADPKAMDLFIITSIFISFALLPISLSSRPAPSFSAPQRVSIKGLYSKSPLGIVGVTISGMAASTLFGLGAVYGEKIDLSLSQISTFMAAFIAGGVMFQIPIGWLSDRFDRRVVLIGVAYAACLFCALSYVAAGIGFTSLLVTMFFLGGAALSIYALALAHTNDHLTSAQIIAASASILLMNGLGSCFGPVLASALMDHAGTGAYFIFLGGLYFSIATFGIYRTFRRAPVPRDAQGDYVPLTEASSPIAMQIAHESGDTLKKMGD